MADTPSDENDGTQHGLSRTDIETERAALALFEQALDIPATDRLAWLEAQTKRRLRLRRRVQDMLRADSLISLKTGAAIDHNEDGPDPQRIGAYRITGLIGRGGMGAVWRGERDTGDFSHTVAIKVIKPGLLSPSLIGRFVRERQTLAHLTHPNIARLYDGGETEDGAPYIVMEYVEGLPLLQWIAQSQRDKEARLDLFSNICRAVAFAHAHLIVHRDLTPSNILVTKEATAKLIDFGIARPVDTQSGEDAEPSQAGTPLAQLSLTPGFAAPERLSRAEVTTAADIYSLGRLLETLFEAPDKEIRAIITKATQTRPADRYATVDALLADLKAHRTGFVVAAMGPSGTGGLQVFIKFLRRHALLATATGVAVVAVVAGLVVSLMSLHSAQVASAEAEARFEQTRAIANTLLFDVYDEVSKVQGATKARELLARTGVDYLEQLADDPDAPVAVRIEAGKGFVRLSHVVGGGQEGTLGRYADATALLKKGETVLKAVYEQHPDDPDARLAYADLLVDQAGNNLYNDNNTDKAREQAQQAQSLLKSHASDTVESARIYMLALQAEGDSWAWVNAFDKAAPLYLSAESFYLSLPEPFQQDMVLMDVRASNLRLLGEAYHHLKRPDEARETLAENLSVSRERYRRDPQNPRARRSLIISLRYNGIVHRSNKRTDEAQATVGEAWQMTQDWFASDRDDIGVLELVVGVGEVYAQLLTDQGRYAQAEQVGKRIYEAQIQRVELSKGASFALRSLAATEATRGGNFYNAGQYAKACQTWQTSLDTYMGLLRRGELSQYDQEKGLPEMQTFIAKACNPPRAGLTGL